MNEEGLSLVSHGPLVAKAREAAGSSDHVVVTFCDSTYRDVLRNWLAALDRLADVPVLVVALDDRLACELEEKQVPVCYLPCDAQANAIWSLRAQAIYALVAAGLNVIHSDVDAVWIKNPMALLERIEADIVSSQGTVYPPECHARWGHVLCYGFIYFRPSCATIELLREAAEIALMEEQFDDQRYLNHQLLTRGVRWSISSPYRVSFGSRWFTCSLGPIMGTCELQSAGVRIAVIPHAYVQRLPNGIEDEAVRYVCHPLSPKDALQKKEVLRQNAAWFIADE